jgi:hemerythrin superfamily protein
MDIFQALRNDHRRMLDLVARLHADDEGENRATLQDELVELLADHARGEDTLVYPKLGRSDAYEDQELVEVSREEHEHLDQLADDLAEFEVGEDGWEDRLLDLERVLKAHVETEEDRLFVRLSAVLETGEALALGRAFAGQETRRGIPGRPDLRPE